MTYEEMLKQATPRPWVVGRITETGLPAIISHGFDGGGPVIAEVTRWTGIGTSDPHKIEANATLIVLAVNHFPALVAALEAIVEGAFDEDDAHEDDLIYICRTCDASAVGDPWLVVHESDCSSGKAVQALAAARNVEAK